MKFIEKILNEELEIFKKEYKREEIKQSRGSLDQKQKRDSLIWAAACNGIMEELNYIMQKIKYNFETGFYSFSIKGEVKKNEDGSLWPKFYTFIKIIVKGEENRGPQEKPIFIKFDKMIPDEEIKKLKNGFLVVEKSNFKQPPIYEIKEENGVKKYPFVTVKNIYSFDPESQEL